MNKMENDLNSRMITETKMLELKFQPWLKTDKKVTTLSAMKKKSENISYLIIVKKYDF